MVAWFKVGGLGFRVPESCKKFFISFDFTSNNTGAIAGNIISSYLFLFPLIPVM